MRKDDDEDENDDMDKDGVGGKRVGSGLR